MEDTETPVEEPATDEEPVVEEEKTEEPTADAEPAASDGVRTGLPHRRRETYPCTSTGNS